MCFNVGCGGGEGGGGGDVRVYFGCVDTFVQNVMQPEIGMQFGVIALDRQVSGI